MKMKRIVSLLLTVLMLLGSVNLGAIQVFAAPSAAEIVPAEFDHLTTVFNSAEERIAAMEHYVTVDGYEIYGDDYSGEIAFKDTTTGQILLTNPYSVGSSKASKTKKHELLSQIILTYTDSSTEKIFLSYEEASQRGQVSIKRIKNGVRVEYSLGNQAPRLLVPRQINMDRFKQEILSKITDSKDMSTLQSYYTLINPEAPGEEDFKEAYYEKWPITKEMAIYVLSETGSNAVTEADLRKIESIIKKYCPLYSFEELDYDHTLVQYEGYEREPANFKLALEYVIDDGDLVVSLPSNGITYNEAEYTLNDIYILPFMGAGANPNTGYTFLPDGSGALFKFEDLVSSTTTVTAPIYGVDYAYQTITGTYEQPVRVPVFGIVENEAIYKTVEQEIDGKVVSSKELDRYEDRGFFAIIEEGDAMCQLSTHHGGGVHEYNTVRMKVTPRPKDSYKLSTAVSVGSSSTWTVVSERRYTGNFKTRYMLLTDEDVAAQNGLGDTYEPSWKGMADAYQDYLVDAGILTKITEEDTGDGIPLYIETFGAIETVKKILSIPVTVMTAMTSFDDIQQMYSDLSADGIKNINFKLTGYANGGMNSTVPYKLKWEKAVGGKDGFEELIDDAKENNYGVYPDFDFAYINETSTFDGVTLNKHAAKSIDNRFVNKRIYSATRQNYETYYQLAMSPAYYYRFIDKLTENYTDYEPIGISVSTLGYALNSDFDKKEAYNREDSKDYTMDAFERLAGSYNSIMTEGGNAYVWKNADHMLDVPLDSSRYVKASYAVPFVGYVLHGYKNFTGSPINMAGDIRYEVLKCIENGAYIYVILSYDNTEMLKNDKLLSKYYSIRYDIWYEDIVEIYKELNDILDPLQTCEIVDHEFLIGERIPDEEEASCTDSTQKYKTMDDGRIVRVTYENGTTFILNYNYFDVIVEGVEVDAYGYVKLN